MQSKIEQQVMAGVATVYTVRQLFSATALKLYVCALALYGLGRLVWVSHVWENFSRVGLAHAWEFAVAAVANTDLLVQLTLLVFVVAVASLVRDIVRSLGSQRLAY